jgi:hypothetical protein
MIWKITREYLNCEERYCVLGVMSDGYWIRSVTVPSCIVMWMTWQLDTWRKGAITLLCSNYDRYLSHTAPVTRSYHSTRISRVTHFILHPIPYRYVSSHAQLVMLPP